MWKAGLGLARFVTREVAAYAWHGALGVRGSQPMRPAAPPRAPTVLFVHGHGGSPRAFAPMERSLSLPGRFRFAGWSYRPVGSVADVAADLAEHVERDIDGPVLVVGHSLGGIVARYWLQELGGHARARSLVTLSSPHRGLRAIPGAALLPLVRELTAGSALLDTLERSADRLADIPCLSIVSERDHFVRPFTHAAFGNARVVTVTHAGHVGVLFSERVHQLVARHLASAGVNAGVSADISADISDRSAASPASSGRLPSQERASGSG
jgi:pimeloyl-ACP methyl ester carboxylesterase